MSVPGLDTAECYDVRCGEWRIISPMSTRRSSVGVGVVNGINFELDLCAEINNQIKTHRIDIFVIM